MTTSVATLADQLGWRTTGQIVHPNVQLGDGATLGAFVVLGEPPRGRAPGELPTLIGPGATIRSHSVLYAGNRIGAHFETGHGAMLREENEIGDDVSIGSGSIVEHHVTIGKGVRIHSMAFVPELSVLEDGCWLGPHVVLTNARYPKSPGAKASLVGPTVRAGAKIGANATILPGVVVGVGALIGAGTVVTRDVPDYAIVVGNPGRVIGDVRENRAYQESP